MPYTVIPDTEFAEGKPARGITMIAMRDNLVETAAGAAGAPKIETAALNPPIAGATYTLLTLVGAGQPEITKTSFVTPYQKNYDFNGDIGAYVVVGGTLTCSFEHYATTARILKNQSVLATWTAAFSWTQRSLDVTCARGDLITFQSIYSGSGLKAWRNVKITGDNNDIAVV